MSDQAVEKEDLHESIGGDRSAFRKYQDFFVGNRGLWSLVKYEAAHVFASPLPGAVGYALRKLLMPPLLKSAGDGVQIGRGVTFRHPGKISIGEGTAIDDGCVLDARGIDDDSFSIGRDVIIARGTAVTSKTAQGSVEIGNDSTIGKNCILSSSGGIQIGNWVGVGGGCYLGGGRYRTDRTDVPMMKQELYTEGPVVIGDDCWIGAGAHILDGVTVGRGSIIGAGAIVREDVPEYTVVAPHQRLAQLPRSAQETTDFREASAASRDAQPPAEEDESTSPGTEGVRSSVYSALDTLNQTRPSEEQITKAPETPLDALGSIEKVNLIVETEMKIEKAFDQSIRLLDDVKAEDSTEPRRNPFETIDTFAQYVESKLKARS